MRRRTVAGAAAVGGAAYSAKRGASARREEQAPEAHDEAPQPGTDPAEQIKELAELREQGILSTEEFAAEKKKLLGL
jgi:uncharacterized membrane protein YebE (DUF533 family)